MRLRVLATLPRTLSRPAPAASRKRFFAALAVTAGAAWPLACLDDTRYAMLPSPRLMAEINALGSCLAVVAELHGTAIEQRARRVAIASCRPDDVWEARARAEARTGGASIYARLDAASHPRGTLLQGLEHDASCRTSNDPQCVTYLPKNLEKMRLAVRARAEDLRRESENYRVAK